MARGRSFFGVFNDWERFVYDALSGKQRIGVTKPRIFLQASNFQRANRKHGQTRMHDTCVLSGNIRAMKSGAAIPVWTNAKTGQGATSLGREFVEA